MTPSSPTVTTPTAASITGTTATLGGNLTSDGGATVTARGVAYALTATNSNPQLGGAGVTNIAGTGTTGVFTVVASGLTPGTSYTFAAYATNSEGTAYSSTANFTTPSAVTAWLTSNGMAANSNLLSSPNHDGVSLLIDYALNLNPTENQAPNVSKAVVKGGNLTFTYYAGNTDVTYEVQASSDLKTWSSTGVTVSAPDGNGNCTATVPLSSARVFLRLVVTH